MPQPSWLPPLNSHENYTTHVSAQQYHVYQSPATAELLIKLNVSVDFYSSDPTVERSMQGLSMWKSFRLPCDSIITTSAPTSRTTLSHMFSQISIPFPLAGSHWKAQRLDGFESTSLLLEDEEDLLDMFLDFFCCMRIAPCNVNRRVLAVKLTIEKEVTLPPREFEAWTSWYDEQKSLNASFQTDYADAISRPRQEVFGFRSLPAATSSSVEALEEVSLEGSDQLTQLCSICLEELVIGSRVARLPCSHLYHGVCVLKWLKRSNVCPMCRYVLSPLAELSLSPSRV